MSKYFDKAKTAKRESKFIDFKREFDPSEKEDWCEIIKDLVAMANTGGGCIVIGLDNGAKPFADCDVEKILAIDPADITNKIYKYTGVMFEGVSICELMIGEHKTAAMDVKAADDLIVFSKTGDYSKNEKQKTAFMRGALYFRHGAKSEPANSDDIRNAIAKKLEVARKLWAEGVRQVTEAPLGTKIAVVQAEYEDPELSHPTKIRLVSDPDAPAFRQISHDESHPYRRTELVDRINELLPGNTLINSYDVQTVRTVYEICTQPRYCIKPKYGSFQYSEEFAKWILEQYNADFTFFDTCRDKYYKLRN